MVAKPWLRRVACAFLLECSRRIFSICTCNSPAMFFLASSKLLPRTVTARFLHSPFTSLGQSNFRLGVTDARVRIQAGFSACKRLEEVSPKCTFVCCVHLVKSRAESTDALGGLRKKHFGRQRLLDDLVPLWGSRAPHRVRPSSGR